MHGAGGYPVPPRRPDAKPVLIRPIACCWRFVGEIPNLLYFRNRCRTGTRILQNAANYFRKPPIAGWTTSSPAQAKTEYMTNFKGKVDGFQSVNLQEKNGKNHQRSFVRIKLENGKSGVISLDSRLNLPESGFQTGAEISVTGKSACIDNSRRLVCQADRG